jgi:GT2 family glycosyltransferase
MGEAIKVSVIIVTWNNEKEIEECLNSLRTQTFKDFNIIVVDNASSDSTTRIVRNKYPEVILLKQQKNLFLTGGNNVGIKYAIDHYSPEYTMVLNPDTKLTKDLIKTLVETADLDPKSGAIGPKVKFFNNKNEGLLNSTGIIFDGFAQAYDRGFLEEDKGQYDAMEEMNAVCGVCVLYRVKALKEAGLYWDRIKMYLDELELSIRLRKKGWKIIYNPNALLYHSYMASSDHNKTFRINKQKKKAYLLVALRHYPLKRKMAMIKRYFLD